MFFTYLWRELRRRMRQALFIAIGLALGIGLVITVTAASAGVKNAQASVLHSLYGVGTDITVTKAPTTSTSGGGGFGFSFTQGIGSKSRPKAGTKIDDNTLTSDITLSSLSSTYVTDIARLQDVAAAAGGLTLTDRTTSGTVPAINFNNSGSSGSSGGFFGTGGSSSSGSSNPSSFHVSIDSNSFIVNGVDIANGELGPLSTGKISSGRTFTTADESSDVALVDASYATSNKLKVGDTIAIGDSKSKATNFKIVGLVSEPAGDTPADVYIPLGVAQTLADMKNDVNTIYVAASSSSDINSLAGTISKDVPGSTITDQNTLASEVTGSLSSAATLANDLGKWLAIAVLIAAFLLASLLTMSAVTRRIREFGTLKALGWKTSRIVGQVMGESITVGIIGGAIGVGLGFLGAALVGKFSGPLTADLASSVTGSATPGGARFFGAGGTGAGGFPGGGAGGFPTSGAAPGGSTTGGSNPFRGAFTSAAHPASAVVHLTATVTITAVVAAVVLAVLGGLIAGSLGGWRAARLRPADALSKVA
ncbi:ABC transporter permease [Trebonia sp.]|uniref:ABC transporter permease n=1 Tax=Trebonia sp. TaxID=2767075 RepID=UPI002639B214|nr:ABC transporter permease [Trebonia sp.]